MMNACVIVTLRLPASHPAVDLELSQEIELQHLVPLLVDVLDLSPVNGMGRPIMYQLFDERRGCSLPVDMTLADAGILTGDLLSLTSQVAAPQPVQATMVSGVTALLRCPSGMVFALDGFDKDVVHVGRYNKRTGRSPDIDLSEELYGSTVSRTHALFRKRENGWALIPMAAQNVTRVNGDPVPHKKPQPLSPRDVITLGGVILFYEFDRLS
jgi:hypothetical protein